MTTTTPDHEYQSATCDVWQVARLCNHMAGHGWEPIAMADGHYDGAKAHQRVSDETSGAYKALKLMVVLFRRPTTWNDSEGDD